MNDQAEIPQEKREPVGEHRGYQIFTTNDGWHEAYRSGRHVVVGVGIRKSGEEFEKLKPTAIDRIILPTSDFAEALRLLDQKLRRKPPAKEVNTTIKMDL